MQRLRCAACHTTPPPSTRSHEPCPRCRGALSREARCAWCLSWTGTDVCGECTAEILPVPDFGAARMLVSGGVDRYALPERVRALSRNQHVALSSRFDAEWGSLSGRLDEARFAASFLVLGGHADEVETQLVGLIPMRKETQAELTGPPAGPFSDPAQLEAIATSSPMPGTRVLAATARVHAHQASRDELRQTTWEALLGASARAAEAVFALVRVDLVDRRDLQRELRDPQRMAEALDAVASRPGAEAWVAIARAWLLMDRRRHGRSDHQAAAEQAHQALVPALHAALAHPDRDVRLCAALLLEDEAALAKLLSDPTAGDPAVERRRERARRALAERGSDAIAGELASGDVETRRQILRALRHPLGRLQLQAVLESIVAVPALREESLRFLVGARFAETSELARARMGTFVTAEGPEVLDDAWALKLLSWAVEPTEQRYEAPLATGPDRQPFIDRVTARLRVLTLPERLLVLKDRSQELGRWLHVAAPAVVAEVVDRWMTDDASARGIVEASLSLHAQLSSVGSGRSGAPRDDRGWMHVLGALDRGGEREAAIIGEVLGRRRGYAGQDPIVDSLWARFRQDPARRRLIMTAGAAFRYELKALRRELDADGPLSTQDPAAFFALYASADPDDAPDLVREALAAVPDDRPQPLVDLVAAAERYAAERVAGWPCTATRVFADVAAAVANRYRQGGDPGPVLDAAARALEAAWARLAPLTRQTRPVDEGEARFAHVVEHIEVELRLIAEKDERRREEAEREAERAEERLRREAEQARIRAEVAERQAEAARMQEQLRAQQAAAQAAAQAAVAGFALQPPPAGATGWMALMPALPPDGIDREPLLPDQPLPTLESYARLLKAMQMGQDVMALFASAGLTPVTWAGVAGAWTQVIIARPHVGQRFAALIGAVWK